MEQKFNTDNFEHMLREATDDFRMYPSKRVWHGIYNDLHPAKKWPSFAVLLLLVTSIMYIGITNPDKGGQAMADISTDVNPIPAQPALATSYEEEATSSLLTENTKRNNSSRVAINAVDVAPSSISPRLYVASTNNNVAVSGNTYVNDRPKLFVASASTTVANSEVKSEPTVFEPNASIVSQSQFNEPVNVSPAEIEDKLLTASTGEYKHQNMPTNTTSTQIESYPVITKTSASVTTNNVGVNSASNRDESGWMEDYALRNTKSRDKWKGRMAYQVYVTPSLGYRKLEKTREYSLQPTNALIANPNALVTSYSLNHASAINLEIGTGILYSASKALRLKMGVQMNYTNYSVKAQELNHPTFTALMLTNSLTNGPVLSTRTTTIANTAGNSSRYLNNNTYQVSLPFGVDLHIAGKDRLKLYVGTTLQPTYILGSQSYLVSADMKNYVEEESFVRPFNINGAVEAFVTYKTQSGVTLNIGPQFRAQFLSTYEKRYNYNEKLYNLGIKMGMTKNF